MSEKGRRDESFGEVCLYLGFLLGALTRPQVYQQLVASLKDEEGIRTAYVVRLRDQLTEALRDSEKE